MSNANAKGLELIGGKLNAIRCALTGAAVLAVLYALCWVGAALPIIGASHLYLSLFMSPPGASVGALALGLICSAAMGLLTGALVAVAYNLFARFDR